MVVVGLDFIRAGGGGASDQIQRSGEQPFAQKAQLTGIALLDPGTLWHFIFDWNSRGTGQSPARQAAGHACLASEEKREK